LSPASDFSGICFEVCRGAKLGAAVELAALPLFTHARRLAEAGIGTGGAKRNWKSYGHEVDLPANAPEWWRGVLCDPQTSGGTADRVFERCRAGGYRDRSSVVGEFCAEAPRVRVS
jgi:selenophosphate synthase